MRPECRAALPRPPSSYLRHVYFDTIAHDREALAYLVRRFGADRVVLGSDFPFDMADPDPVGTVRGLKGLFAADRARILGGNARALFGGKEEAGQRRGTLKLGGRVGMPSRSRRTISSSRRVISRRSRAARA